MTDARSEPAAAPSLRDLLSEALDLARRARELDAQVARSLAVSRGRCATGAAAILQRYDQDLEAWMSRAREALRS